MTKTDIPESLITSANDPARPVIPPKPGITSASWPVCATIQAESKPAKGALRLQTPDAQKQPAVFAQSNHLGGGHRLPNVTILTKINIQQHGR